MDSSESESESWGDSDDDDNDDDQQSDDETTASDDDKSADLNKTDEEEDKFVHTPDDYVPTVDENVDDEEYERINKEIYDDVNVELKDAELDNEEKGDEEMTCDKNVNVEHGEVSKEVPGDQVKDDAQATVTAALATQKTEVPLQSSSISSDYATKFLNFDNIPSGEMEIISMMDIKVQHEDPSIQTSPLLTIPVTVILETLTTPATTIPPPIPPFIPLQQQSTPIPTPTTTEATTSTTVVHDSETLSVINPLRATIKSEVLTAVKEYLGTSLDDALYKKSVEDIRKVKMEHATKQQESKYTIKSSDKAALKEFDQKRALFETMTASKTFNKHPKYKALYHALMESILADEDAMDKGVADIQKKRKPDDADKDEDHLVGPDQGLKRKKTGKDAEPSKKAKSTESSKGTTKFQPKSTGKSVQAEETVYKAGDTQVPQNLGEDTGNTDEPPVVNVDPRDWFKKPERPPTLDPKWNEGKTVHNKPSQKWLSDLAKAETSSKTFDDLMSTLIDFSAFDMNRLQISDLTQDILIVPVDYFFNNDLAYLQGESTGRTYTTSFTKIKAAKYDLPGIEDMIPNLWSLIKVAYDKHALLVKNAKVNIWYGYGHLEEIEVRRSDKKLYKFMKGDFPRLHLNDIEDMLLLVVQNRLLPQRQGHSLPKKLNISKPITREKDLSRRAPYTTLSNPQGVIYEDKLNRKRLMRSDELYKFSDGTLQSVRDTLHDMATNLMMWYNKAMPKRGWSHLDKTWSHIMVKEIDRQLRDRRLMRSLEKFVGGRDYGEDLRLL
ncbi:hypothetical protein Tco_0335362 [Tanacetum coccineum]